MIERAAVFLIFAGAIGSGLVAGIFFAFSSFVMAALARLPAEQGVAAMQSINITVINPGFFLAFFGTALICLALIAGWICGWGDIDGKLVLPAACLYLAGCIGVTMACNVPLNEALAALPPATPEAAKLWLRYLVDWAFWNHVRTVAPLLSAILFTLALM
ncbi:MULTISPECIES: anthrone oxygenase family protein [Rhodomicrobium]|uniref:anthrone oxygenase family protein n=1 Tax=Rhodomicrobium TaxID=1068 RepID=UPI000B4A93BB|nr:MULTISPECIES: anthrone oxygenase family protein [Rhodomicrobium]